MSIKLEGRTGKVIKACSKAKRITCTDHHTTMLKYLCLIVLIAHIYSAPVDDELSIDDVSSHGEGVVPEIVKQKPAVQTVEQKKITTKPPKVVEILESGSDHQTDGSYSFHYLGADGTFREEAAVVKNPGTEEQHLEITGAYSFFDADGKETIVQYKADNRGFVPVGSNIPDAISLAAKENSQLPAVKKDKKEDDDDMEDSDIVLLRKIDHN